MIFYLCCVIWNVCGRRNCIVGMLMNGLSIFFVLVWFCCCVWYFLVFEVWVGNIVGGGWLIIVGGDVEGGVVGCVCGGWGIGIGVWDWIWLLNFGRGLDVVWGVVGENVGFDMEVFWLEVVGVGVLVVVCDVGGDMVVLDILIDLGLLW